MNNLNINGSNLVNEIELALKYKSNLKTETSKTHKTASSLALAYEKARNAVEYRDEHLIRQAAIERILKRRLFLNQSSNKIANLLIKELSWAKYIETQNINEVQTEKFKDIIQKYRDVLTLLPNSDQTSTLVGLCACEIDEILNFNPINQIVINFVSTTLESIIEFDEPDKVVKSIQIYIATERSFAKNNEILIKYKLLKVLLPKWSDSTKLFSTLTEIDSHLNYKLKDHLRRKVMQVVSPFNLIKDLVVEHTEDFLLLTNEKESLKTKIVEVLETKYKQTKNKVLRASTRSIIYIFLTKMVFAILIEVPFDILLGKVNFVVLGINILFPPSLMILFNSRVRLPGSDNTSLMTNKIIDYLYQDISKLPKEEVYTAKEKGNMEKMFYYVFLTTSIIVVFGIIYLLNLLSFNFVSQIIFLFFLSVVSFFAFRVSEISNDYLLPESQNDSFLDSLLDYIFLPIIKSGQWLSGQIARINILSFIFDFIIEAPLKTFLEILEQWLHFVRVKKEEFLG